MPKSFEIIRARTKDDVAVLIDRIMRTKQNDVGIVLPKNSIISANPESLKMIQQEAEGVGRRLFLATENSEIKASAKKLNISFFNPSEVEVEKINSHHQIKAAKRIIDIVPPQLVYYEKEEIEPCPEQELTPSPAPVLEEAQPLASDNRDLEKNIENFYNNSVSKTFLPMPKKAFSLKRLVGLLIIIGIFSLISVLYLLLPKANIKISAKTIPVKISIPVAVSKNTSTIDLANGIIPGQYFSLSKTGHKTIDLSNNQEEAVSRAGGFIDIYNAYSSAPQKLVAQTRFETKDGKIFRLQNAIIIPGAQVSGNTLTPSFVRVAVLADQPGEEYNIGPSYFTIPGFEGSPKYAGFYAKSTESMAVDKIGSVLTKELLEKNKQELLNELVINAKNDAFNTIENSRLKLIEGASTTIIKEFNSSASIGSITKSADIKMKLEWQAIVFNEDNFKTLVNYFVSQKYSDLKSFDFEGNINYPQVTKVDFRKKEMFFVYNINKTAALAIDINDLKSELVNRDENEIRELIAGKSFINSATILLWPFWVNRAPNDPNKINVIVDKN